MTARAVVWFFLGLLCASILLCAASCDTLPALPSPQALHVEAEPTRDRTCWVGANTFRHGDEDATKHGEITCFSNETLRLVTR